MQTARKRCYFGSTAGHTFEFRILGPLEVVAGREPVTVGGTKARALLAFLLLHRNQVVSRERLVDGLWGQRPPKAVAAELRVYVAKLRKTLGPKRLATRPDGYALLVHPGELDADRFERAAREGSERLAARDAQSAARVLTEALALWRGRVLADLADEPWAAGEARRLEELRLAALEERLEADLALGRHARVVAELEQLVAEQPYRERLRGQLMLALYRCGRQSEALELYRQTARVFEDELGIEPGPELRARERAILNHDPALRIRELARGNLPSPPNPLVGRRQELDEVSAMLARPETRLVTLTGPGGSGKTRLGLELAAQLETELGDPAFFVDLAPLAEPALVLAAIARTLGVEDVGAAPLSKTLAAFLRHRRLLLVLDNFEHLVDAGPDVAALLAGVPGLTILATSRSPLHLRGEWRYEIGPLLIEDAVSLFIERARAVKSGFDAIAAVEILCRRLDGLPLAIELAAARVNALTPQQIVDRLAGRLDLLVTGARDAPERQRTLRATIDWSYKLLDDKEQRLFERLSVFAGGCTLDAAEQVCGAEADTLASLVDKSLLRHGGGRYWMQDGRFSMLETIREYALECLAERGGASDARSRHAAFFIAGAEANDEGRLTEMSRDQVDWFEGEHDNLRAALDWLHEQKEEPELELRLVVACHRFWIQRGSWPEGRQRLEAALPRAGGVPARLRALVMKQGAEIAWRQGDYDRGKALAEAAIALDDEVGTNAPTDLGAYIGLAICESKLGNRERAVQVFKSAAAMARAEGNEYPVAIILNNLGHLALTERDFTRARTYFEESAAINRRLAHQHRLANNLVDLGFVALAEARVDDAAEAFRERLSIGRVERSPDLWAVEGLATLALERAGPIEATRLLAATTRPRAELGFAADYYPIGDEMREQTLEAARAMLSADAFAAAWAEGEALSLEAAAEQAALVD